MGKHTPLKRKRVRNKQSSWLTSEIKQLLIQRARLKGVAMRIDTYENWRNYKITRNSCNSIIEIGKIDYYQISLQRNSGISREIWKTINELIPI